MKETNKITKRNTEKIYRKLKKKHAKQEYKITERNIQTK